MIKLTNEMDNPLWVNMDHVVNVQIVDLGDKRQLGLKFKFVDGSTEIVLECWRDVQRLIKEEAQ